MSKKRGPYIRGGDKIGKGGKQVKAINGSFREGYRQAYGKPKAKASPVKTAMKATTSLTRIKPVSIKGVKSQTGSAFAKTVKVAKAKPRRRISQMMRQAVKKASPPKNVARSVKRKPPTKGR